MTAPAGVRIITPKKPISVPLMGFSFLITTGIRLLPPFCLTLHPMMNANYELVIGLEVHVQLLTQSKLFCGDSAAFVSDPNTHISPITLAHPGTLPMMNRKAIEYAVKLGLALQCDIVMENYFARKNYFYPDLPKGYQVSQHTTPICRNGFITVRTTDVQRPIRLNRIHIEEDAGKSLHEVDAFYTSIDLNRAGVPLLEVVSEPDLRSADEAYSYLTELRKLVRWLGICDGNMEEGSLRCDANISIRKKGETRLGTRVEVKNLNSIRHVKKAIEIESERLVLIEEAGGSIVQETRSFDADKGITFPMRTKEDADDYRYFPEPDLTPFHLNDEFLDGIKAALPLLPEAMENKFISQYQLSAYDAALICDDRDTAAYYESVAQHTKNYKAIVNWIMGPVKNHLNESGLPITALTVNPPTLASLIALVDSGTVSFSNASSKVLQTLLADPSKAPLQVARELNLLQETDTGSLQQWVNEVITLMPEKVKEYKSGKKGLLGLFAGEVKKLSKGKADMQTVNQMLQEKLNNAS